MDLIIRMLESPSDMKSASELIWHTFYKCNLKSCDMSGAEAFRDSTEAVALAMNSYDGFVRLYGAFSDETLIGVCGFKVKTDGEPVSYKNCENRICLLFVSKERIGCGIGRALLDFALAIISKEKGRPFTVKVNSSDYALGFYLKHGFYKFGERTKVDGIIFTPLEFSSATLS